MRHVTSVILNLILLAPQNHSNVHMGDLTKVRLDPIFGAYKLLESTCLLNLIRHLNTKFYSWNNIGLK